VSMKLVKSTKTEYQLFIRKGIVDPWYRIGKNRCKTRTSFEQWVDHLQSKNWFTPSHLVQFEAAWKEAT